MGQWYEPFNFVFKLKLSSYSQKVKVTNMSLQQHNSIKLKVRANYSSRSKPDLLPFWFAVILLLIDIHSRSQSLITSMTAIRVGKQRR